MARKGLFALLFLYLFHFIELSGTEPQPQIKCLLQDSECLTAEAQKTLQIFIQGIPELGIKSVDKLLLEPVSVHHGNFTYVWSDIKVAGLRNAIIDNVSIDMDLKIMRVLLHSGLVLELNYEASGAIVDVMPIYGAGKGEITLNNTTIELLILFGVEKDCNGKDYMDLKTYYYGFDSAGGVHYHFDDVYDGDKKMSEKFHSLINVYWRTFVANFGGFVNRKITDKIFEVIKIYLGSRPLEHLAFYN